MFLYHFGMIYGTNLLTRCPVSVPVFCMFFVSEKLHRKVCRKKLRKFQKLFFIRRAPEPEGQVQRRPTGPALPLGAAHP